LVKKNKITTNQEDFLTVFFDGSCPICTKEIDFYRTRNGAEFLSWIDVSDKDADIASTNRSRQELLARFHVMRTDGKLISGGKAFAELWASLPGFTLFGKIFQIPGFSYIIDIGYDFFLILRPKLQSLFKKKYHD
jgi:predicted DCC family thiol-disulfide oxidoreductase YuxK